MLAGIDMDAMQMRLDTAMQMQGAAAVPTELVSDLRSRSEKPDTPAASADPTGWEGDMIFNVSFGNEPFDRMVISAIDRANAISGGVDV